MSHSEAGESNQEQEAAASPKMCRAFIGLGSNMGDRAAYLEAARQALASQPGLVLTRVSSLYESEPVGYPDQRWFLNQVVAVDANPDPYNLLRLLQRIEQNLGRERLIRWGPRVVDLDLLLYGDAILTDPQLIVPHPRLYERSFVLVPLNEIAPDFVHPDSRTTQEHLKILRVDQRIRLFR